jgi:hypothetical protein
MSPEKREAVMAYFKNKGMSEAELAFRFRDDKPQWPEPTIEGMHAEAAKWPQRIKSFEVRQDEIALSVRLERRGGRTWQCSVRQDEIALSVRLERRGGRTWQCSVRQDEIALSVRLERRGGRTWQCSLEFGKHYRLMTEDAREWLIRDFCMMQIANIEKLGNPRWDALVAEEATR